MQETIIVVTDFLAGTISVWGKIVAVLFLIGIIPVWVSCHKKLSRMTEVMINEITEAKNRTRDLSARKLVFKQKYRQEFIDGIVDDVQRPVTKAVSPILKRIIVTTVISMVFLTLGILFMVLSFIVQ